MNTQNFAELTYQKRLRRMEARQAKRKRVGISNLSQFQEDHPKHFSWMVVNKDKFSFATAMLEAVVKYGELTEGQMAAVERCMAREQVRAEVPTAVVDMSKVREVFDRVKASGYKKTPTLRFTDFILSLAPDHGNNPGAIYVKGRDGVYLGKVVGTTFHPVSACTPERTEALAKATFDPHAEAIRYGQATGECCCCGAELTDPVSIERNIGPICEGRYFGRSR